MRGTSLLRGRLVPRLSFFITFGIISANRTRVACRTPCRRTDGRENRVVFSRSFRGLLVVGLLVILILCTTVLGASARDETGDSGGFVALSGGEAQQYDVPGDVREVWRSSGNGVTQTR